MRRYFAIAGLLVLGACASTKRSPDLLQKFQGRQFYTCCNIRYENSDVSDANYHVGSLLAAGTPVTVVAMSSNSVTVDTGTNRLNLIQQYGNKEESLEQYVNKILLPEAPRATAYPADVQAAIREGRVERGMIRDQVIMSLGYPPTHRTPSLGNPEWLYWQNRWITFKVVFGDNGKVSNLIGGEAVTKNVPIVSGKPKAAAAKKQPARAPKKK